MELTNPEGGTVHESNGASNLHPQLQASIDRLQEVLAVMLSQLTALDRSMIVIAVSLATCIEIGVTTAINVILPDMQGNVGVGPDEISWVVIVYGAAFLCALAMNTTLARPIGHRNHLLLSLLLYSIGSGACFASHNLVQLLTARAFMGFGGGTFLIRSQATIYRMSQGRERAKSLAMFGIIVCLSKAIMPFAFGQIADHAAWNYAFLLPVPLALIAAVLIFLFVPNRLELFQDLTKPDTLGMGLLASGIIAFQIFISRGEQDGWLSSTWLDIAAVIACVSLIGFVVRDLQPSNPNPLLNLRVLASQPSLSGGLSLIFILGVLLGSGLYVLPQYLRNVQTYSAGQTGAFFFVDGLATVGGVLAAGRLLAKLKVRVVILIGLIIFSVGNIWTIYLVTPDTPGWLMGSTLLLHGFSMGILLVSVGNFVLGAVDLKLISFGASIYLFFRQLGATIGVTATVILVDHRESLHSARLLDMSNRFDPSLREFAREVGLRFDHLGVGRPHRAADAVFSSLVSVQSRLLSYQDVFWTLEVIAIIGAVLLLPGSNLGKSLISFGRSAFHKLQSIPICWER